jgi:hypothetical protein
MKEKSKKTLEAVFSKYEEKLATFSKADQIQQKKEDEYISAYRKIQNEVIRPTLDEIGDMLKEHGHDYKISEKDETNSTGVLAARIEIRLSFFPVGFDKSSFGETNTPFISFAGAVSFGGEVRIHSSNMLPGGGGSSGPKSKFNLSEINVEIIEAEAVSFIEEVLTK